MSGAARYRWLLAGSICALVLAVGATVALAGEVLGTSSEPTTAAEAEEPDGGSIYGAPSEAGEVPDLEVLEGIPSGTVAAAVSAPVEEAFGRGGVEPAAPAFVAEAADGSQAVVSYAAGSVCVTEEAEALTTCNDAESLEEGQLMAVGLCLPDASAAVRLVGLLPDEAQQVAVQLASGDQVPVALSENLYEVGLSQVPRSLSWSDSSGRHEVAIPLPPEFSPQECAA